MPAVCKAGFWRGVSVHIFHGAGTEQRGKQVNMIHWNYRGCFCLYMHGGMLFIFIICYLLLLCTVVYPEHKALAFIVQHQLCVYIQLWVRSYINWSCQIWDWFNDDKELVWASTGLQTGPMLHSAEIQKGPHLWELVSKIFWLTCLICFRMDHFVVLFVIWIGLCEYKPQLQIFINITASSIMENWL